MLHIYIIISAKFRQVSLKIEKGAVESAATLITMEPGRVGGWEGIRHASCVLLRDSSVGAIFRQIPIEKNTSSM